MIGTVLAVGLVTGALAGFTSTAFIVVEAVVIAALLVVDRVVVPIVGRWDRGAAGEEVVGRIIEKLTADGWLAIHDVSLGRGNVDHVLIGPGGLVTIETKSHGGRIAVDRIDERMFKQAYAEAKLIERISGRPVTPLLVFSRAYLSPPVSRRRGVTVLPARMLAGHLARRPQTLSTDEVAELHRRLSAAVA
jgi:hypothetical protein